MIENIEIGSVWVYSDGREFEVSEVNDSHVRILGSIDGLDTFKREYFLSVFTPKAKRGRKDDSSKPKHSHYHKDVSNYDTIDIYAVCKIFNVQDTSGCLQHAIKKRLVTGKRGHKDRKTDIQNAIDTLNRLLELESE